MSDLDEFLAAIVLLLILLTWLEATMSKDYIPWGRRSWFRRLRPSKTEDHDPPASDD
jgi:hypothetical protein